MKTAVPQCYYFVGQGATGKSLTARAENPLHFVMRRTNPLEGYDQQPCIIMDEFDGTCLEWIDLLVTWCKKLAPVTDGSVTIYPPPKIVVISNLPLQHTLSGRHLSFFESLFIVREFK